MPLKRPGAAPKVVLVGRPNVGKSTLFNSITNSRQAIVAPLAGTTRDVNAQAAEWQGNHFSLVDTGGMFGAQTDPLHELVVDQGRKAIATADLVVFVVDGREGLVPGDEEIALALRSVNAPVIIAVNKTDDRRSTGRSVEFYSLGFEPIVEIAAEHGQGVGDLLDEIVARFPEGTRDIPAVPKEVETRVAIVGRPNVGKSSLLNRLLKEERAIVSDMPGTTRDTVDAVLKWQKRTFRILDTAGIRRPGRVARAGQVEGVAVVIARRAIEKADVAVLVVDSVEGATDQDATIAGEADKAGAGVIIVANKWDLMKGRGHDYSKEFDDKLRRQVRFLDYAPILHISALTGERTPKLLEAIDKVADARNKRVGTGELNRWLAEVTAAHPPASPGRHEVRIMYAAQTNVAPPTFVFFTNTATSFHFSYERFLINQLREAFGMEGTPIRVQVRRRKKSKRAGTGKS
jgi:GTP-binding protein